MSWTLVLFAAAVVLVVVGGSMVVADRRRRRARADAWRAAVAEAAERLGGADAEAVSLFEPPPKKPS